MSTTNDMSKFSVMHASKIDNVGELRYSNDLRQIGGILLVAGFCAVVQPLGEVVSVIGPNGTTVDQGIPLSGFIAGLCVIKIGILAIFIGYNITIHDWSNQLLNGYALVWAQTAFISYFTTMTAIGRAAKNMLLISPDYSPTQTDNSVVGAMGILAVIAYGFTFIGTISFMLFSIYSFEAGKPQDRDGPYYRGRMMFYMCMLWIAGFSQFFLGSYVQAKFGDFDLQTGPIGVAVYVVSIPALNIVVGLLQMFNATWGLARSVFGIGFLFGEDDMSYQISVFLSWFVQFLFQVVISIGIVPGGALAAAPAAIATISFGLNIMPAYLDFKARSVPDKKSIESDFYGSRSIIVLDENEKEPAYNGQSSDLGA
jgi:hypothetical protein